MRKNLVSGFSLGLIVLLAGCATTGTEDALTLKTATQPAYSIDGAEDKLIVSVSPARQTMQLAGSTGAILGAGISAISNAKHRRAITEAIGDYDCGGVFQERLEAKLEEVLPDATEVSSSISTAGYRSRQEAIAARYASIGKQGHEMVLDLDLEFGLFGFEGTLIAKVEGSLHDTPSGKTRWRDAIVVNAASILASDRLADPTKQLGPNFSSPRLSVEDDAIAQWTGDGGKVFRSRYVEAVDGSIAALFTELGLLDDAQGHYYLGKQRMNQKKFEQADQHFRKALALEPGLLEAQNGFAVNLAHNKQVEEAVAATLKIVEAHPEYAAAHYNLAYWYAVELNQLDAARPYYTKAKALGLPALKKIDKALEK